MSPPDRVSGWIDTPIGPLGLTATPAGLSSVRFHEVIRPGAPQGADPQAGRHLALVSRQLAEYFAGERREFDVSIDWAGIDGLRRAVLEALCGVRYGRVTTYGELAATAAEPGAAQAVGQIMGSNPFPIVVPCHRVLAADGLGGFAGGLRTKEWLLAHEGVLPATFEFG